MAENKTRATDVDPAAFIAALPDPVRREDAEKLSAMMGRLSGYEPKMWGPTMIGFGTAHYRYESGCEGDMFRIGFAPRGRETVLYLAVDYDRLADQLARLGKHRAGKSCLYVKSLASVDESVLEEMIVSSIAYADRKYPIGD